jgi:hypothetical protein
MRLAAPNRIKFSFVELSIHSVVLHTNEAYCCCFAPVG